MTYESWKNAIIRSSKSFLKSWKKTSKRLESKKNLLTISKKLIQTSLIICAKQTSIAILKIIRDKQNHDQNHENHYHENDDRRQDSFNQLRIFWIKKIVNQISIFISINQTTIFIFSFSKQLKIIFYWTSKRSINWQMNSFWKIFLFEKITTINFVKIIHRLIISIDFRFFYIVIIIIALIIINLTSCFHIIISSFYLINSKEKIISYINQNRKRS